MTNAEQWLADLEAKAKAATPGPWVMDGVYPIYSIGRGGLKDKTIGHAQRQWDGDFISAANPATVLRLVAMVRWLAAGCDERITQRAYDFTSPDMAKSESGDTYRGDRHGHGRNVDDA